MIKMICTDIDGTLLNKHREVDNYTKEIFRRLAGRFEIVLASSRMPKALWHIQEDLLIEEMPLICYNGALILSGGGSFDERMILSSITIPAEAIRLIVDLVAVHPVHLSTYLNNTWVASEIDAWTAREINNTRVKPDVILGRNIDSTVDERILHSAHKIMLMGEPAQLDQIEAGLNEKDLVVLCRSKDTYLEITPTGTDKSNGLTILLERMPQYQAITLNEVMAFGDNHNDFELLRDVKFGIAVGNSIQRLKDVAYAVTGSNHEHGVAHYLEDFFLKER
jgi:Cof subfamily protein (haloacid dehalogenase superfamily)